MQATVAGIGIGNAAGFGRLPTGGSVRYRLYSSWVSAAKSPHHRILHRRWDRAPHRGILTADPIGLPAVLHVPFFSTVPIGIVFLGVVAAYALLNVLPGRRELQLGRLSVALRAGPPRTADAGCRGRLAVRLLRPVRDPLDPRAARLAAVHGHLHPGAGRQRGEPGARRPGRVRNRVRRAAPGSAAPLVLGAILAYRTVFDLLPLAAGLAVLLARELSLRRTLLAKAGRLVARIGEIAVPPALTAVMFLGGLVLLFSGATRSLAGRLAWLNSLLPLPIIEASHFLASAIGILMLFVARGLWRRLDAAWLFASVLSPPASSSRCSKVSTGRRRSRSRSCWRCCCPTRRFFSRRSSLLDGGLSVPWAASIVVAIIASAWLARYTYRHAEYSGELWWQFMLDGHAPDRCGRLQALEPWRSSPRPQHS